MSGISPRSCGADDTGVTVRRQCDPGTAGERAGVEHSWGRREFMGTVAVTAVGALVPGVATALTPARTTVTSTTASGAGLLADWTIDDMFGVWPRYADPIPHGRPAADVTVSDEPLDAL